MSELETRTELRPVKLTPIEKHPLKSKLIRTLGAALAVTALLTLTGCNDIETTNVSGATTQLKLLDVTTAAAAKVSKSGESFWNTPTGHILRCYNTSSGALQNGSLNGPHDCQNFPLPPQFPQGTELLAVNKGAYQETQTAWLLPKTEQMIICDNDESFWSGNTEGVKNCESLNPPEGVNQSAKLVSLNSGTNQEAQSFWENPDKSVITCSHEKQNAGFLGLTARFGKVRFCEKFQTPTDKFPKGVEQPVLAGVTSDDVKPGETFWQDKNGVAIRCENQRVLDRAFLGTSHIGPTTSCDYWPVNNLPI